MVGVPALTRCDCGPSSRTTWPALSWVSLRMIAGPASSETASAVSALMMVRKVRYWNRLNPLIESLSKPASSSSMASPSVGRGIPAQRRDDALHRGRSRPLDQHAHARREQLFERRDEAGLVGIM